MSEATLQGVHDAIAAHIKDINEDEPEFLTEWLFIAATATGQAGTTGYYYRDSDLPYHHSIGLLQYGLGVHTLDEDADD